jgi:ETC complex I subunit conserved region
MTIPVQNCYIRGYGIAYQVPERCFYTIPDVSTKRFRVAYLFGVPPSMTARIFKPAKNAMQSGRAKTREWQLDYEPEQPRAIEPLMGWTSSGDMKQQLTLHFDTREEAVAYCERKGIAYQVIEPKDSIQRQVAYSDNFAFRRGEPWTH